MIDRLVEEALLTAHDIVPIAVVVAAFQAGIIREQPANLRRILIGLLYVFVGLTLFRLGLADSLVPIGGLMAEQLARPAAGGTASRHLWLYGFAAAIGLVATLIEPTVIAVADRVRDLTGGALRPWALRLAVALGVAAGLALGTVRIVVGFPAPYLFVPLIGLIAVLAATAPRAIVPLAFDSGAMATSVVTVPLIAAFGLALAETLPGRDPLTDGFGLILLALLGPMASVLAFAQLQAWRHRRRS